MEADEDGDGKLSFDEFARTVANTVCDYVLFFLVFGQRHLSLPKSYARVHRRLCISILYIYHRRFTYTYLLHFSGYCKANDAWRFILDVANARWPLTHFNRLNHSAADNRFTHISMTPPGSSDNQTIDVIDICYLLLLNINLIWLPSFTHNLRILEFYTPCSFAHSRSRRKRLINYIAGVRTLALYLAR